MLRIALCFATLSIALGVSTVHAQSPYVGSWTAGPTRIEVAIQSWGTDCGPRPQSVTSRGGGAVQITQDGDNLVFRGSRTNRTDGCWSENRAVRRVSTTAQAGQWRTVCRTPPGDAHGETGTYVIRATSPDALELRDVSDYDWQLNDSHCTAAITTTQSFTRTRAESPVTPTPQPPAPPAPAPEPPTNTACTPGAAARLNLYPASHTVEPGGRVCLRARVVDAANCAVRNPSITWELTPRGHGELRDGCYTAPTSGAGANGEVRVSAAVGTLRDVATVRVHTMDLSDLIARRGETGVFGDDANAAPAAAPAPGESVQVAARATPQRSGSTVFVLIVASLGFVFACVLLFFVLRKRKPAPRDSVASNDGFASVDDAPFDGTPAPVAAPASTENMICPTCRRGYAPGATSCASDGTALLPYSVFTAQAKARDESSPQKKLCPKCGERYGMDVTFCGKDGTTLVVPR